MKYYEQVSKDFEKFAKGHYVPALRKPEGDVSLILAGVRMAQTRGLDEHVAALREIITMRHRGKEGRELDRACLEALLSLIADETERATLLVQLATRDNPVPASSLAEQELDALESAVIPVLLSELEGHYSGQRLKRIAKLLARHSKVPCPEPIQVWSRADKQQQAALVKKWRAALVEAGLIGSGEPGFLAGG